MPTSYGSQRPISTRLTQRLRLMRSNLQSNSLRNTQASSSLRRCGTSMPKRYTNSFRRRWSSVHLRSKSRLGSVRLLKSSTSWTHSRRACRRKVILEQVQAFPIPGGIPKTREQCESSVHGEWRGTMARAYSQDLRDRVIDAALGGMPARRAAAQFEIGIATAISWVRRARASGERVARRQGQPRRSKLDPQRDFLLVLVEHTPDMTIVEMQQRLATERSIKASVGTIWTFLDRCGLTFKKSPRTRRSGIGPTS